MEEFGGRESSISSHLRALVIPEHLLFLWYACLLERPISPINVPLGSLTALRVLHGTSFRRGIPLRLEALERSMPSTRPCTPAWLLLIPLLLQRHSRTLSNLLSIQSTPLRRHPLPFSLELPRQSHLLTQYRVPRPTLPQQELHPLLARCHHRRRLTRQ